MGTHYVLVGESDDDANKMELPSEADGSITLATLQAAYPGATGLKFKNPKTGAYRGMRLVIIYQYQLFTYLQIRITPLTVNY